MPENLMLELKEKNKLEAPVLAQASIQLAEWRCKLEDLTIQLG